MSALGSFALACDFVRVKRLLNFVSFVFFRILNDRKPEVEPNECEMADIDMHPQRDLTEKKNKITAWKCVAKAKLPVVKSVIRR